jgi:hypothetical protein
MLVSRDQNAGQNREIKTGNRSFENISQFKYLRTTVTNQNLILLEAVFMLSIFFDPEKGAKYRLKSWSISTGMHGFMSKKTEIFMAIAVSM